MPPTSSIERMEVTGKIIDYPAHMYSIQEHTSVRRRQAKGYAPHPLWLLLPAKARELTCRRRQGDKDALLRPGGGALALRSR